MQVLVPSPRVRLLEDPEAIPDRREAVRSLDIRGEGRQGQSHEPFALLTRVLHLVNLEEEGQGAEDERHDHRGGQTEPPAEGNSSNREVILAHREAIHFMDRARDRRDLDSSKSERLRESRSAVPALSGISRVATDADVAASADQPRAPGVDGRPKPAQHARRRAFAERQTHQARTAGGPAWSCRGAMGVAGGACA